MIKKIPVAWFAWLVLVAPAHAESYQSLHKEFILNGKDDLVFSPKQQQRLSASYNADLRNFLYNVDTVLAMVPVPSTGTVIDCSAAVHPLCYRLVRLEVRVNGLINRTPGTSDDRTPVGATMRLLFKIRDKLETAKKRIKAQY